MDNSGTQERFSGYNVYMRERKNQLIDQNPDMPQREIIQKLSKEWDNLEPDKKQKYLDSASTEKEKYQEWLEMNKAKKTEISKATNKRKNQVPDRSPSKSETDSESEDQQKNESGESSSEMDQKVSKPVKTRSKKKSEPDDSEQCSESSSEMEQPIKRQKIQRPKNQNQRRVDQSQNSEVLPENPKPDRNKKRVFSGYVSFCRVRRPQIKSENPGISYPGVLALLGQDWNKLDLDTKQKYVDEAAVEKREYFALFGIDTSKAPRKSSRSFTGYYIFARERRDQISSENPYMDYQDVQRTLGEEWRDLDDETRDKYIESAEAEKQQYLTTIDSDSRSESDSEPEVKESKLCPNPELPGIKKGKKFSGYGIFAKDRRPEITYLYPEMDYKQVNLRVAQEWREMDLEVKQKYLDKAAIEKLNYEKEMEKNKPPVSSSGNSSESETGSKKKTKQFTGFSVYLKEKLDWMKAKFPNSPYNFILKKISKAWNFLGPEGKKKYNEIAQDQKRDYEMEMEAENKMMEPLNKTGIKKKKKSKRVLRDRKAPEPEPQAQRSTRTRIVRSRNVDILEDEESETDSSSESSIELDDESESESKSSDPESD